jgi:hypothetical protein
MKRRRKRNREVSMSDIMPKFDQTQSVIMENTTATNNINYNSTINNLNYGKVNQRMNFVQFIRIYPCLDELPFIGHFTVLDIMTIRLLCRDCAIIFNEDFQYYVIRLGNLDNQIRINFWIWQAPFFE